MSNYTSAKHSRRGHQIEPKNCAIPYRSNKEVNRLIIEACLITLFTTVKGNKASSDTTDLKTLGPIVLRSSSLDWMVISSIQPNLDPMIAPKKYRKFFLITTLIMLPSSMRMLPPVTGHMRTHTI